MEAPTKIMCLYLPVTALSAAWKASAPLLYHCILWSTTAKTSNSPTSTQEPFATLDGALSQWSLHCDQSVANLASHSWWLSAGVLPTTVDRGPAKGSNVRTTRATAKRRSTPSHSGSPCDAANATTSKSAGASSQGLGPAGAPTTGTPCSRRNWDARISFMKYCEESALWTMLPTETHAGGLRNSSPPALAKYLCMWLVSNPTMRTRLVVASRSNPAMASKLRGFPSSKTRSSFDEPKRIPGGRSTIWLLYAMIHSRFLQFAKQAGNAVRKLPLTSNERKRGIEASSTGNSRSAFPMSFKMLSLLQSALGPKLIDGK
mmetsp:Transcript_86169/g.241011  ORF Transcript_86169/g.241011 Transcript_86169/m.241011 type:complete len:317 (+) Transcript_86169:472-1422(+)